MARPTRSLTSGSASAGAGARACGRAGTGCARAGAGAVIRRRNAEVIGRDRRAQPSLVEEADQRQVDPVHGRTLYSQHEGFVATRDAEVGGLVEQEQGVVVGAGRGGGGDVGGQHISVTGAVDGGGQVGDDGVQDHRGGSGFVVVRVDHQQQIGTRAAQPHVVEMRLRRVHGDYRWCIGQSNKSESSIGRAYRSRLGTRQG